jgi:hypothetical protein
LLSSPPVVCYIGEQGLSGKDGLANYPLTDKEATRMRYSHRGPFREQLSFLRRQFLQDGDLPFTDVLTEVVIAQALAAITGWVDRIFSLMITLWVEADGNRPPDLLSSAGRAHR